MDPDVDAIWQVHLNVGAISHCVRWSPWPPILREGEDLGVEPPGKTFNCKLLLPPGEYK